MEKVIHISSINREKIGQNKPEDFIIKFDPVMNLDNEITHEMALDKATFTYSWYNITDEYNNNEIKYSHDGGTTWTTVKFDDGMYIFSDIDIYLHERMKKNNHYTPKDSTSDKSADKYHINIHFVSSTFKIVIKIDNNYQLDLRNSKLGELIGFTAKIIKETETGSLVPNITNSIDEVRINCDVITNSILNGVNTNTLVVIPTDLLVRSLPFTFEPKRLLFHQVSQFKISQIRFYITDALDRPIKLNNINWYMTLILRSKP